MKKVRYTDQKLIISGSIIELYSYYEPVRIDPLPQSARRLPIYDRQEKKDRREVSSVYRSRQRMKRLLNANTGFHLKKSGKPYMPVSITFTFKENIQDIARANYAFTKFIQRFNYSIFEEKRNRLKYVLAIEFQERGAIHYHVVFFNLPFRKNMKTAVAELWSVGHVKVKAVRKMSDLGNYIMKYITKENFDSRLVGKKCYFSSRNLFKPVEIKDPDKIRAFMHFVKPEEKVYEKSIDSPEYGPGYLYQKYTVKDLGLVRGFLDLFVKPGYFDPKL